MPHLPHCRLEFQHTSWKKTTGETSGQQQRYCSATTIKTALVAESELEFSDLSTLCIGETSGGNIFEGLGLRVQGGQTDGAIGHD